VRRPFRDVATGGIGRSGKGGKLMSHRLTFAVALVIAVAPWPALAQETAPAPGVLAREPQTPAEEFDYAVTMLQLSRPELARQYLENFLASSPDDATLLALREKHGTAMFVRLSRIEALQPAGQQTLDLLNAAAHAQLADPAFQQSLLQGLGGNPRERDASLSTLRALGGNAVVLLVQRLGAGVSADEEAQIIYALTQLGDSVVPPLEAALFAPNPRVQLASLDVLGRLKSKPSLLKVLSLAYDESSEPALRDAAKLAASRILYDTPDRANQITGFRLTEQLMAQALPRFESKDPEPVGDDGLVAVWTWDASNGSVLEYRVSPASASLYAGEFWTRRALAVSPEHQPAQVLLLGFLMQRDILAAGWDKGIPEGPGTAHDLALALGPQLTTKALELGLKHDNPAAVLVSLRVLSQTGSRSALLMEGSPLMRALGSSDGRVQFAAASTIMQLDPIQPFPGSTRVVNVFARALNADPQGASVVIDPNAERGSSFAGTLVNLGYEPNLAGTGQSGFEIAASHGNIELAVVHLSTVRWDLLQTVANLRTDPRTAGIPIVVYGPEGQRAATRKRLQPYKLVAYVHELSESGDVRAELSPVLAQLSTPPLTPEQRSAQIAAAAYWLRHIAEGHREDVFTLNAAEESLSAAVNRGEVATDALIALGAIGKPSVQQRLADVGLADGYDAKTREVAILQLAFHIQRFGRLIDNEQARQAEQAWRNEADPALQSAWASVVGALGVEIGAATDVLLEHPALAAPLP
jgi:hypothetical protein